MELIRKAQCMSGGIASLMLNPDTRCRWVVGFTSQGLCCVGNCPARI